MSKHPDSLRRRAVALFAAGRTRNEVSLAVGVPYETVCNWISRNAPRPQAPKRYPAHVIDDAVQRYRAGESTIDIAADVGCTPQAVADWLKRAGVQPGRPGGEGGRRPLTVAALDAFLALPVPG